MNTSYKRQYRELADTTKEKISLSLKGRPKSDSHKLAISSGMTAYWQTVPSKEDVNQTNHGER